MICGWGWRAGLAGLIGLCLLLAMPWAATPSAAQAAAVEQVTGGSTTTGEGNSEAASILERARESGATIIVIEPGQAAAATEQTIPGFAESVDRLVNDVRTGFLTLARDAPNFPSQYRAAFARSGGFGSFGYGLVLLVVALAVGYAAEWLIDRWARPQMAFLFRDAPESRAEKIAFLLARAIVRILRVLVQAAVAAAVVFAVDPGNEAVKQIALLAIALFAMIGCGEAVFRNIAAADTPEHQLLPLSQDRAWALYRDLRNVLIFVLVFVFFGRSSEILGLPPVGALLAMAVSAFIAALASIWFTLRQRGTIERIILGRQPDRAGPLRRGLARLWYVPVLLYFLVAWATTGIELLLGVESPLELVAMPVLVALGAIIAYGVMLMLADLAFRRRTAVDGRVMPAMAAQDAPPAEAPAEPVPDDHLPAEAPADPPAGEPAEIPRQAGESGRAGPLDRSYAGLAERAAGWIAALGAMAVLMDVWGLDSALFGGFWSAFWEIVLVAFIAWLAYEAVRISVDRRIAEEGVTNAAINPMEEEGPRRGLSRLGTLLPMFRTFLLLSILVFAGMVVLSALGVDVTPLFAGAGVIGLAIGFGAQTLIRDIFSGAFFLIDDAFRLGEYVNVGPVKGTVERVSIRSMQLRHQLGPLHTIPFGEITHLQNYSRDWVMMKLPLRVTYDTDVEQVRKLIKKLGQELLEDPLIGHLFLLPLKSQGVYQMEDSAMIIRVKFMTRPGDQFMVRKAVYARIRELFAEHGIRFAHREVTVRLAEDGHHDGEAAEGEASDIRKAEAAAGGALSAIAAAEPAAGGSGPAGGDGR